VLVKRVLFLLNAALAIANLHLIPQVLILEKETRYPLSFIKVKVKVNFTLEQATKAQRGSRGIALLFL
jgi:hypothetical protein